MCAGNCARADNFEKFVLVRSSAAPVRVRSAQCVCGCSLVKSDASLSIVFIVFSILVYYIFLNFQLYKKTPARFCPWLH